MGNRDITENLEVSEVTDMVDVTDVAELETASENEGFKQKSNKETDGNEPDVGELNEQDVGELNDESPDGDESVQPVITRRPRRSSRLERDYKHFNTYGY